MKIMKSLVRNSFLSVISIIFFASSVHGGALKLTSSNIDQILGSNDIVFINFYADWCRFSNILAPTWDEAADKVSIEYPEAGKVVIGKVDCDSESKLSSRFQITKYPTLKLFRNARAAKREYRGQRSADAIATFISEQLRSPIVKISSLTELKDVDPKKRVIIGYFESEDKEYEVFRKFALNLKDDCLFYAGFGDVSKPMHPPGQNLVVFKTADVEKVFPHNMSNYDHLNLWANDLCLPLVRQITFENAEELTEEGLPFLILFHNAKDTEIVQMYNKIVETELIDQKQNMNFLTADGHQFMHPLHHLGKSSSDLPLIAIDSFKHMYLFPDVAEMEIPGRLKQFLADLFSGKLHREFHYGPDSVTENENQIEDKSGKDPSKPNKRPTSPPKSTFAKLAPSKNRYTLLKDEL